MLEMLRVQQYAYKKELDPTSDTYYGTMDVNDVRDYKPFQNHFPCNLPQPWFSFGYFEGFIVLFYFSDGLDSRSNSSSVWTLWVWRKKKPYISIGAESTSSTIITFEV